MIKLSIGDEPKGNELIRTLLHKIIILLIFKIRNPFKNYQ